MNRKVQMPRKSPDVSLDYEALAGKLVVFEGADGTGKTTLVKAIEGSLLAAGVNCVRFAFPGSEEGTIGWLVYKIHHRPSEFGLAQLTAASLQTLHVAAHVYAIETRILPALRIGTCVLLDRFWWSTWAYGLVGGVSRRVINQLIRFEKAVWGDTRPEAVVYLVRPGVGNPALNRVYERLATREDRSIRVVRIETRDRIEETLDATLCALLHRSHTSSGDGG